MNRRDMILWGNDYPFQIGFENIQSTIKVSFAQVPKELLHPSPTASGTASQGQRVKAHSRFDC
jgi:hypothetical protein